MVRSVSVQVVFCAGGDIEKLKVMKNAIYVTNQFRI